MLSKFSLSTFSLIFSVSVLVFTCTFNFMNESYSKKRWAILWADNNTRELSKWELLTDYNTRVLSKIEELTEVQDLMLKAKTYKQLSFYQVQLEQIGADLERLKIENEVMAKFFK